ncbi:MAG: heavy-metal-associated domain-containing protein [Dehalococcoidia bacterium]
MLQVLPHRAFIEPHARVSRIQAQAGETSATLRIDGLLCSLCAANVRGRLERIGGVRAASVDLGRGEALVSYDAERVAPGALIDAIDRAVVLRPLRRLLAKLGGQVA